MIRQAVEGSTNGSCSLVIAKLSNRMVNGHFDKVTGGAYSMMKSVAPWKSKKKDSVRPIGIGDALKGVITRAHCDQIRLTLADLVEKHQLGMLEGGYETGVHTMRALANQCKSDGEVILIYDFRNAFNSCSRNLLVLLSVTCIPDIAHFVHWLYAEESELFSSTGETIISSEGVHQGCGLSNLLFILLMRYVMRHLPVSGLSAKGSYLDDAFTKSSPRAALESIKAILDLEAKTNLGLKFSKCYLHAPNEEIAQECRELFASVKDIKIRSNMNLTFLKTPIGADEFVEAELTEKLKFLSQKVEAISKMPFKLEAFTLLRTCWS